MRVLVANDDETSRRVLHRTLVNAGYEVVEATTKDQAMQILHESVDSLVVLLDFTFAKWNGTAIISEASADPVLATRHAYVLMLLRDETFPLILARALSQMSVKLITKPIRLEAIVSAVMSSTHWLEIHDERTISIPLITQDTLPDK